MKVKGSGNDALAPKLCLTHEPSLDEGFVSLIAVFFFFFFFFVSKFQECNKELYEVAPF